MMKHEFEDRVGVAVSAYEYANIESAYMACNEGNQKMKILRTTPRSY